MKLSELGFILNGSKVSHCHCSCMCWGCKQAIAWDCKGVMVLRMNRTDKTIFWGCSEYPVCVNAYPFALPEERKALEIGKNAIPRRSPSLTKEKTTNRSLLLLRVSLSL